MRPSSAGAKALWGKGASSFFGNVTSVRASATSNAAGNFV
jgi:hypothetical protein